LGLLIYLDLGDSLIQSKSNKQGTINFRIKTNNLICWKLYFPHANISRDIPHPKTQVRTNLLNHHLHNIILHNEIQLMFITLIISFQNLMKLFIQQMRDIILGKIWNYLQNYLRGLVVSLGEQILKGTWPAYAQFDLVQLFAV
jgi:hypothetical protein